MRSSKFLIILLILGCTKVEQSKEVISNIVTLPSPSEANSSLPHLIKGEDDKLYMSWVEKRDSNWVDLKFASLRDNQWSEPELIASGNDWFVNWADYPMLAVDQKGNKIAHYLAKSSAGTYSYDVNIVLKHKDSSTWSGPVIPHADGTPTEHGFVTMLPKNDGSFLLTWLDGRNTGGSSHDGHGESGGAMTIRSAVIDMNGTLSNEVELDGRVCDCCQTGGVMSNNAATIVYRDRSVDEIRDMAFVSQTDSGWSQPRLIAQDNWKIEGCPVNGPRIAGFEGTLATAWFTSALSRPTIKVAFKAGEDFNLPIILDDTSPIGRVDIAMLNTNEAIVSWLDGGDSSAIKYRKVNINGAMSPIGTIDEMSESRSSGFPQLEAFDGNVYLAWTQPQEDYSTIKVVKLKLPD